MSPKALTKLHAIQKHLNNDIVKLKNDEIISLPETSGPAQWGSERKLDYQRVNKTKLIKNKQQELKWVDDVINNRR
jgi:hypothetical protein